MKYFSVISALLLSATSTTADDYLYLRCKVPVHSVTTNASTSKIVEDRTIDDVSILKIDFTKKTIHDSRAKGAVDVTIKNDIATIIQKVDDDEIKMDDVTKINLAPPYSISAKGTIIAKTSNESQTYRARGLCEEVDASVWEESFKKSDN